MVYLYAAEISALSDPSECPKIMEELPTERQKKILNAKQKQSRLQSLGAGLLLNQVLRRYGVPVNTLGTDVNGKPTAERICFNLAHSGNYVICAVSNRQVGCDIEQIKEAPKRVAERAFTSEESEYIRQFSGEAYNREFYRLWTRKESFLKMTGVGLRVPLNTLQIKDCYLKEYEIPGYQVTVCAEEHAFAEMSWVEI